MGAAALDTTAVFTIRPLEARLFGKDAEANILAEDDLDQDG